MIAWVFFSACSSLQFCLTPSAALGLDALCGWDPVLTMDREPVLALNSAPEALGAPEPVLVLSVTGSGGAGVTGALPFATFGI